MSFPLGLWLRSVWRETRGAGLRLVFSILCLAIGVAAVVAVASLSESLEQGIRSEARQLLAADLAVSASRPLPDSLDEGVASVERELGVEIDRTPILELVTLVAAPPRDGTPGRSQLVELKAVGGTYPYYGVVELNPPASDLHALLGEDAVAAAPDLLSRLGLGVGDQLRLGGASFRIAAELLSEPDRVSDAFSLGPRVFVSIAGLERTGLLATGSRVDYRELLRVSSVLPEEGLARAKELLGDALPETGFRVETWREAQPSLRRGLDRVDRFLGLVALLSLLLGGVGVAQSVRSWLATRLDAVAVLECLGVRPREVLAIFLGQACFVGLIGSVLGAAAGLALQWEVPRLLGDLLPAGLVGDLIRLWQPWAVLKGLVLGVAVSVLFALPSLLVVLRVPPVLVLRRDAEPLPGRRIGFVLTGLLLVLGLAAVTWAQARSPELAVRFLGGVLATSAVLTGAALLLTRSVARLSGSRLALGRGNLWLRHGTTALARPGADTLGAIVALGLGLLVLTVLTLVESHVTDELEADLPSDAPSVFMIDIQPDQWDEVQTILLEEGAEDVVSVPVVMARLREVDDRPIEELVRESDDGGQRWALTREQRLTYLQELADDNEIIDGALWGLQGVDEVSLEQEYAEELRVGVGSELTIDVQGVLIDLAVSSIRTVDWESFGINFYTVVEPGVLDDAPQWRLATARLPPGQEQRVQDRLAQAVPNVTLLQIRSLLDRIVTLLERLLLGVRFLGSFTLLTGLVVLAGAVAAASARRGREVAILKTLGTTRAGVVALFGVEYLLIGTVSGLVAAIGAGALAWLIVTQAFELDWSPSPWPFAAAILGGAMLAAGAGIAASFGALRRRPVEALRHD